MRVCEQRCWCCAGVPCSRSELFSLGTAVVHSFCHAVDHFYVCRRHESGSEMKTESLRVCELVSALARVNEIDIHREMVVS